MASVDQALDLIRAAGRERVLPAERVALAEAAGRRLAAPAVAAISSPPADVSAMDGYAVRFSDMAPGARLAVVGEARAGAPWSGVVGPGEAARIFTGAHVPAGADHILIQEEAAADGDLAGRPAICVAALQPRPASIRRRGRDFEAGAELVPAGLRLAPGALALAAAGNAGEVSVRRRPRLALLANGDELIEAGSRLAPGQVVNSVVPALAALAAGWGATVERLGVARDDPADVAARIAAAAQADVIVSIGGASVGDHDVARAAFAGAGFAPAFEKIAVKPGKPTWFSMRGGALALGLPGNPAAAFVCAHLFLKPLLAALEGAEEPPAAFAAASERDLGPGGGREEYLRAVAGVGDDGLARVRAAEDQDSSLLSPFLTANALIRRPKDAPAAPAGTLLSCLWLDPPVTRTTSAPARLKAASGEDQP